MQIVFFYFMISIWSSGQNELNKNPQNYSSEELSNLKFLSKLLNKICKLIAEKANPEVKHNLKEIMPDVYKFTDTMDRMLCDINFNVHSDLIQEVISSNFKLMDLFIKDLNSHMPKNDIFRYYIAHFIRSLKLFVDLLKCKKELAAYFKNKILENKQQLCYRIPIKVSFDSKLQDLKIYFKTSFKDFVMFYVKDDFFYIDILRISINFDSASEFSLPINILEMFDDYFRFLNISFSGNGKVVLNSKIELSNPKMPFGAYLKVNSIEKNENNKINLEFLNSHINILIHFLKRTLSLYLTPGFYIKMYNKITLIYEYPIICENGFSITTNYFEQGNSELYMPIFILKTVNGETKELLRKNILENIGNNSGLTYSCESNIFFKEEDYMVGGAFFKRNRNTFEALLPKESLPEDESTPIISERDQYLIENRFILLLNHKKIVSLLSNEISKINNKLCHLSLFDLTLNWTGGDSVRAKTYDLNVMYDPIME